MNTHSLISRKMKEAPRKEKKKEKKSKKSDTSSETYV